MDYGRITPLLVKAIQEQQEQIEQLKSEIEALKSQCYDYIFNLGERHGRYQR